MAKTGRRLIAVAALAAIPLTAVTAEHEGWQTGNIRVSLPFSSSLGTALQDAGSALGGHAGSNQASGQSNANGSSNSNGFGSQGQRRGWGGGSNGYGDGGSSQFGSGSNGSGTYGGNSDTTSAPTVSGTKIGSQAGVVMVNTTLANGTGAGTGIVWKSNGTIITNYHVVSGSTTVRVTAANGQSYSGKVVGYDQTKDIAVVKITTSVNLTPAKFDSTPQTGESVSAIGQGGGLGSLYKASGKIVAQGQSITAGDETGGSTENLTGLLETNAPIVPGYSGGPLMDAQNEVVGIDTAASGTTPIKGFAIPTSSMMSIASDIVSGIKTPTNHIGSRAALGIEVSNSSQSSGSGGRQYGGGMSDGQSYGGQTSSSGALVAGVLQTGAMSNTSLSAGDVITKLGSTTISSADDLTKQLNNYHPGDKVSVTWLASDGSHTQTITLGTAMTN